MSNHGVVTVAIRQTSSGIVMVFRSGPGAQAGLDRCGVHAHFARDPGQHDGVAKVLGVGVMGRESKFRLKRLPVCFLVFRKARSERR